MQPSKNIKKTLVTSALTLGLGVTFNVSAETFTITASGIPDVSVDPVPGFTTLGFGATIKGSQIGSTCKIVGRTAIRDSDIEYDLDTDGNDDDLGGAGLADFGSINGAGGACNTDTVDTASGSAMILEIDGVTGSTVSISIPDVVGTGFTYTPSDESCVMTYTGDATIDACASLASGSATGIAMAAAHATESPTPGTGTDYGAEGTTRMVLAGEITIDAPGIAQGTAVSESVIVTVTYE